jgi:hypothetical protein
VIRRRPTAVYRVIDEEELLGRDAALDTIIRAEPWRQPAGPPAARGGWGGLSRRRTGWGSTALAVAALAAVAAALLRLGGDVGESHASVARSAASSRTPQRLRTATKRTSLHVEVAASRHATPRPRFIAASPSTGRARKAEPRLARRRAAARQLQPSAGSPPAATVSPADPSPAQAGPAAEFGFER